MTKKHLETAISIPTYLSNDGNTYKCASPDPMMIKIPLQSNLLSVIGKQKDIQDETGIPQQTLSDWQTGKKTMSSVATIPKLRLLKRSRRTSGIVIAPLLRAT